MERMQAFEIVSYSLLSELVNDCQLNGRERWCAQVSEAVGQSVPLFCTSQLTGWVQGRDQPNSYGGALNISTVVELDVPLLPAAQQRIGKKGIPNRLCGPLYGKCKSPGGMR